MHCGKKSAGYGELLYIRLSWLSINKQLGPTKAMADPNDGARHLVSEVIGHGQKIS